MPAQFAGDVGHIILRIPVYFGQRPELYNGHQSIHLYVEFCSVLYCC